MIFNCKLQFLHGMVDSTLYNTISCGHFGILHCISKWGNGDFLLWVNINLFDLLNTCIVRPE